MKLFGLSSSGIEAAKRSLDFVSLSTLFTVENIANNDTPGYKAKSLKFEDAMKDALAPKGKAGGAAVSMARSHPAHFPFTGATMGPKVIMNRAAGGLDGNNVDMDKEITRLGELELKYSVSTRIAGKEFAKLVNAIELRP